MKLTDSASGGGFRPQAKNFHPSADGDTGSTSSRLQRGESLVWTGIAIAGVSAAGYGLWFLYRLLDSVFGPAVPMPTALLVGVIAGAVIGAVTAALGFVMVRRAASEAPFVKGAVSADDRGLAA